MLILDAFAERYGWTWEQILDAPQRVLDVLPQIWESRNDVRDRAAARERAAEKAKGGGVWAAPA